MFSFQSLFRKPTSKKYAVSICCIEKDENEYLSEWISFHRKIGVAHFYIYNNDSKVAPDKELAKLIEADVVTVINFPGKVQQLNAYQHCIDHYSQTSDWIAFIDVDEYIVPKNGNLERFLRSYRQYGGLGINWLVFGSNGHKTRTNQPQVESFTKRSPNSLAANAHIKSIVQTRYTLQALNPHFFRYVEGKFCVNENFKKIEGAFSDNSTHKIQINHYHCRSEEEYLDKINRGMADSLRERQLAHFHDFDAVSNEVEDHVALKISRKPSNI